MRKVDFLVIGAQKSGTTALDYYLRSHTSLSLPPVKEVHFFDNESEFITEPDYDKYHSNFSDWCTGKIHGEVTPIYMYWAQSIKRIYDYNPCMKIIIILRNPVDRAYSHWNMEYRRSRDRLPFNEAIRTEVSRCKEALPLQHRVYSYADRGYYTQQLHRIFKYFSKENILILKHEDLRDQFSKTLIQISLFLDVPEFPQVDALKINSGEYTQPMDKEIRADLVDMFSKEVSAIEKLLDWDCTSWRH